MKTFSFRTLLVLVVLTVQLSTSVPHSVEVVFARAVNDTYEGDCQGLILKEVARNMGQPSAFNPDNPHYLSILEPLITGLMSYGVDVGYAGAMFDNAHPPGTGTHNSGDVEIFWHPGESIIRTYWKVGDWAFALVKLYTPSTGNPGMAFKGWDDLVIPVAQKYWKMYEEKGTCGEDPRPTPTEDLDDQEKPPFVEPDCSNNSCESTICDSDYSVQILEGNLNAEAKTCYINSPEMDTFVCGMFGENETYECNFSNNTCVYSYRFYCEAGCEEAVGLCYPEPTEEPITDPDMPISPPETPELPQGNYDLSVQKVDVFQAILGGQLVSNKPTVVRVFLNWPDPATQIPVDVTLTIDGGVQKTQRFLVKNQYSSGDLSAYRDTVNFHIPGNTLSGGNHTFQVQVVLRDQDIEDPNPANNTSALNNLSFVSMPSSINMMIASLRVENSKALIEEFLPEALPFLADIYPVSSVNVVGPYLTINPVAPTWLQAIDYANLPALMLATYQLKRARQNYTAQLPLGSTWPQYAVAVFPDYAWGDGIYGSSYSWARRDVTVSAGDQDADAHEAVAHEIGHHLLGGTEEYKDNPPKGYNLPANTVLYHGLSQRIEDLARSNKAYINFMGAAGAYPAWVNIETWNRLVSRLSSGGVGMRGGTGAMLSILPQAQESLQPGFLINGAITSNGQVVVDKIIWMDRAPVTAAPEADSGYYIQVISKEGALMDLAVLEVDFSMSDPFLFSVAIAADQGLTGSMTINQGTEVLWRREAGGSAPILTLHKVGQGELISGQFEVGWDASDPDGDPLSFSLSYSADGGQMWLPLETDLLETQVMVDSNVLPGCDACLVRLLANDGWNSTEVTIEQPFRITQKGPTVSIVGPQDQYSFMVDDTFIFSAIAYDMEDGLIGDDRMSWQSSIDGALGTGSEAVVNGLSLGTHTITVSAQDAYGQQVQDSITLMVEEIGAQPNASSNNSSPDFPMGLVACIFGLGLCGAIVLAGVVTVVLLNRNKKKKEAAVPQNYQLP